MWFKSITKFSANAGLQADFDKENATILDYLKLFITEDFCELISVQTNLYADQYIEANPDSATSRQWKATTAKEIRHSSFVFANRLHSKATSLSILEH